MVGRLRETVHRHAGLIQAISVALILLALFVFTRALPVERPLEWLAGKVHALGVWGPVVFGLLFVLLTVVLMPGVPIALAAGALFGPVEGAVVISLALTASAALSFMIGRFLARRWVARKVGGHPRVQAVYRAVGEGGWKVVVAVRLSHALQFGLQSFLFGLTPIPFRTYLLATLAAMLPGAILYVYLGHLGAAALEAPDETWAGPGRWQWAARVLGLLAAAATLLYVTHLARRAFKEKTGVDPGDPDSVGRRLLEGAEAEVGDRAVKGWPWATLAVLLVSVLLLTAAAWSYAERDTIRQVVGHWFLDATPPR